MRNSTTCQGNFTNKCSNVCTRGIAYNRLCLLHRAAAPVQNPFNSPFALIKLKVAVGVSLCPCIFSGRRIWLHSRFPAGARSLKRGWWGWLQSERRSRLLEAGVVLLKDGACYGDKTKTLLPKLLVVINNLQVTFRGVVCQSFVVSPPRNPPHPHLFVLYVHLLGTSLQSAPKWIIKHDQSF